MDGDGAISRRDLAFAFEDTELADRLLAEADADRDGVISSEEFSQLMQSSPSTERETATCDAGSSDSATSDVDAVTTGALKGGAISNDDVGEALGAKLAQTLGSRISERLTARLKAALVE